MSHAIPTYSKRVFIASDLLRKMRNATCVILPRFMARIERQTEETTTAAAAGEEEEQQQQQQQQCGWTHEMRMAGHAKQRLTLIET